MEDRKETYWSKFAYGYDEGVARIVGKAIQQTIFQKLSEERNLGEVVEFGCGTGFFTKAIVKNANSVFATDLSDEMLEQARVQLRGYKNVTVKKAACENISFPSKKFDTVVFVNVIHFIKNPCACLKESYRMLKDGGLLILADFTGYGMRRFDKLKLGIKFVMKMGIPPRHFKTKLSPDEFSSLVEDANFKVEEIQLIGGKTKALYLKGIKPKVD